MGDQAAALPVVRRAVLAIQALEMLVVTPPLKETMAVLVTTVQAFMAVAEVEVLVQLERMALVVLQVQEVLVQHRALLVLAFIMLVEAVVVLMLLAVPLEELAAAVTALHMGTVHQALRVQQIQEVEAVEQSHIQLEQVALEVRAL